MSDLADRVYDAMTEFASDDGISGFIVHRGTDGTAAVTYRPGAMPAYTAVLRQTLTRWAERLRDRGYVVEVQSRDDRSEKNVPQWLRITGWGRPADA